MKNATITLMSETNLTANLSGETDNVSEYKDAVVFLDVSGAFGTTPTLDVAVQHSPDGLVWYAHAAFTQATAATAEAKSITGFGPYVRAVATLGGTAPDFTFTVKMALKK